jgi:glutathione S-transferase
VRQRFTELGVSYIARAVPVEAADREELRRKTGTDEIPALVLQDGTPITGGAEEIITYLDRCYTERADAHRHRKRAAESAGT